MGLTSCILIPIISLALHISPRLPLYPLKIKQNLREKKSSWKLQCDTVSRTGNPFVHTSSFAKLIAESLVWLEASGFYYTMDAGLSLELFLDILLLPCVTEILQL